MRVVWGLMLGLVAGGLARAEEPTSLFVYVTQPGEPEMKAAYPTSAFTRKITGETKLSCLVAADKKLTDCRIEKESPADEGFGAAALSLTPLYRLRESDELGRRVAGRRIPVAMTFFAPGDKGSDWAKKPTAKQMLAVLPKLAFEEGVGGKTVLGCDVMIDGALKNCAVEWERPAGYGFGGAALKLVDQFRFKPATRAGQPVVSTASIPIVFGGSSWYAPASIEGLLRDPPWAATPVARDLAAAFPASAEDLVEGQVVLRCGIVASGELTKCKPITESPKDRGFAKAALELAASFKIKRSVGDKLDPTKYVVDVPFHFRNPAEPDDRILDRPTWTKMVDPAVMKSLYPPEAVAANVKTGLAEVNCAVDAQGKFSDCHVSRQQPDALGFGSAALAVARIVSINPWTKSGFPVDGLRFTLPVRFNWQEAAAGAAAAPSAKP